MPTIAKMLDTRSKKEQEQRVGQLLQMAQTPVMSVMVLIDPRSGRLDVRAAGVDNASIDDIKFVLRSAIDQLTASAIQAQQQASSPVGPPGEFVEMDNVPPELLEPDDEPDEPDHNPT